MLELSVDFIRESMELILKFFTVENVETVIVSIYRGILAAAMFAG